MSPSGWGDTENLKACVIPLIRVIDCALAQCKLFNMETLLSPVAGSWCHDFVLDTWKKDFFGVTSEKTSLIKYQWGGSNGSM